MDIRLVTWERLDTAMEAALLTSAGRARKVIASMIAVSGGGSGSGGTSVVGESPIRVGDNGDGTGFLELVGAGASIVDNGDGTFTLTIGGDGA